MDKGPFQQAAPRQYHIAVRSRDLTTIKIEDPGECSFAFFDPSGASNALIEHFHFARYISLFVSLVCVIYLLPPLAFPHPAFLSSRRLPHCPHFLHKAPKSSPKTACSDRVRQVRPFNLPDLGYPLF
jgi:hypothetical protein